ncbi:MAG: transglutaminase-like domain-containing protein [Candidatus Sericytochromatia bacterium]|nr:transglutaminase-like domain-containing protein [Candidatus Sericytochromatia bacterium]
MTDVTSNRAGSKASWRDATPWVDSQHPAVKQIATRLVADMDTREAAARACYRYVRDAIPFGFPADRLHHRASDVLTAGYGDGLSKSTLLTALWRAAGFPARQWIVHIPGEFLAGFVYPGRFLVHAVTELRVGQSWCRTDTYLLDTPLAERAREAMTRGGSELGWAMDPHLDAPWEGAGDSLSRVARTNPHQGPWEDLGTWLARDPGQLHDHPLHGASWRDVRADAQMRVELLRRRRSLPLRGPHT